MINEDESGVPPVSVIPWNSEINFYSGVGDFLNDLQIKMNGINWTMSPAAAYEVLAWAVEWGQMNHVYGFDHPAWFYVAEKMKERSLELAGTGQNAMLEMRMDEWAGRSAPSPADLLRNFDWFMSLFRKIESIMTREIKDDDVTPSGHVLTLGEAVNGVLMAVDWCSKHHRFQYRTPYGWAVPHEWMDFVRDEVMEWRDALKDQETIPTPSDGTAFSVGS